MNTVKHTLYRGLGFLCVLAILMSAAVLPAYAADTNGDFDDGLSVLEGVSILFIGDSYLAGFGLPDMSVSWCERLGSEYGMVCTNIAISNSTLVSTSLKSYEPGGCSDPICKRELPEGDFDIVFLNGGSNDWSCAAPLGSLESRNATSLSGALNVTIDRLRSQYPDALLVYMTPWNSAGFHNALNLTTDDYVKTAVEVCENRDVTVFHACDPTVSGVDASSPDSRDGTFLIKYDIWHLNMDGHDRFLPVIAHWLAYTYNEGQSPEDATMFNPLATFIDWAKAHPFWQFFLPK